MRDSFSMVELVKGIMCLRWLKSLRLAYLRKADLRDSGSY